MSKKLYYSVYSDLSSYLLLWLKTVNSWQKQAYPRESVQQRNMEGVTTIQEQHSYLEIFLKELFWKEVHISETDTIKYN